MQTSAILRHGAELFRCAPTLAAREATCSEVQSRTGAVLVHPYNDPRVIAGQGTIGLEVAQQVPEVDAIVVPISGGGMISGTELWGVVIS